MKFNLNQKTIFSLLLLILAIILTSFSSKLIVTYFPNRPIPEDLGFKLTPYIPCTKTISEIIPTIMIILIILIAILKHKSEIYHYLFIFALLYLSRALCIILTPLGHSWKPYTDTLHTNFFTGIDTNGFFFSGHLAVCFLTFLLSIRDGKKVYIPTLILTGIEIITLITSRSHYSIDLIGAILVCLVLFKYFPFPNQKLLQENQNQA